MNGMPRVTVVPDRITVRPGEATEVEVTIQNTGRVVEHYDTSIVGLPGHEASGNPPTVKLRPGESGTVQVNLKVPARPAPDAGLYTLGVLVRSPYQRQLSRCEELRLDVQPAPGISIAAAPEVATGGGTGSYGLRLANDGNTALDITLQGSDPEGRVRFFFRPRSVRVAPNASAPAQLTVRAAVPLSGQEARRMLTIKATATGDLSAEKLVTFVQKPRVPGGPLRFAGIAAAVAVLAAATLAGALMRNAADNKPAPGQTQQTPAPGPPLIPPAPAPQSGASSAASSTPSGKPSSAAPLPSGTTVIDFSQPPDGRPPGDRVMPAQLWDPAGVKLSVNVEQAPPGCADATFLALRKYGVAGAFLTSSREGATTLCNTLPIRIGFAAPVRAVHLTFMGNGSAYQVLVQQSDGTVQKLPLTPPAWTEATLDYPAPAGVTISQVQFGHANPDPKALDPTILKKVVFTVAK
jgi:hypothetical protein